MFHRGLRPPLKTTCKMKTIVVLNTTRTHHRETDAALRTLTVRDLIELLEQYDEDDKVIFSNDGGYTYGRLDWETVTEYTPEESEL